MLPCFWLSFTSALFWLSFTSRSQPRGASSNKRPWVSCFWLSFTSALFCFLLLPEVKLYPGVLVQIKGLGFLKAIFQHQKKRKEKKRVQYLFTLNPPGPGVLPGLESSPSSFPPESEDTYLLEKFNQQPKPCPPHLQMGHCRMSPPRLYFPRSPKPFEPRTQPTSKTMSPTPGGRKWKWLLPYEHGRKFQRVGSR